MKTKLQSLGFTIQHAQLLVIAGLILGILTFFESSGSFGSVIAKIDGEHKPNPTYNAQVKQLMESVDFSANGDASEVATVNSNNNGAVLGEASTSSEVTPQMGANENQFLPRGPLK